MIPGKFITLEGGEGAGKSSNLAAIKAYLESRGLSVLQTREPGGTDLAEHLRQLLLDRRAETWTAQAELLVMFAARAQHLQHVIRPALAAGQWVLCDRFTDATYAYQGSGRGMALEAIAWLESFVQGPFRPDLTILLDVPVGTGMGRVALRGEPDRIEAERQEFFEAVRQGYLLQAINNPARFRLVDASQPLADVQQAVCAHLQRFVDDVS